MINQRAMLNKVCNLDTKSSEQQNYISPCNLIELMKSREYVYCVFLNDNSIWCHLISWVRTLWCLRIHLSIVQSRKHSVRGLLLPITGLWCLFLKTRLYLRNSLCWHVYIADNDCSHFFRYITSNFDKEDVDSTW